MSVPAPSSTMSWRVIAAFAAVYMVWSSTYLAIRFALETMPPLFISGTRFVFAGTVLYIIARRGGAPNPHRAEWRTAALLGLFMFVIANACLMTAEQTLPSGLAATLYATVPLWFALLGWLWLGEKRPNGRTIVGLVMGFAGIVLLVNPGSDAAAINPLAAILVVISAVSWAFGSLLSRRVKSADSLLMSSGMNLLVSGLMLLAASLVIGEFGQIHLAAISLRSLASVIYLATASSIVAFIAYMWLLAHVPHNRVATYAYVNPVFAVLLGTLTGDDVLTVRTLVASAIIIAAVALITISRSNSTSLMKSQPETTGFRSRLKALAMWNAR
jgi:drug/metabolite transporter (DMT)-like permease